MTKKAKPTAGGKKTRDVLPAGPKRADTSQKLVAPADGILDTVTIRLGERIVPVSAADYIRLKTKDLKDFGYSKLTETEVEQQLRLVLAGAGEKQLSVIGGFVKKDVVLSPV